MVIGEAGRQPQRGVAGLCLGLRPDKGETLSALAASGRRTDDGVKAIRPDAKGYLTIDKAAFPAAVAGDLPAAIGEALAVHQMPLNHNAFDTPAVVAAWHIKPSWFVVSAEDRMLDPNAQRFFAQRMHATTVVVNGSHASLVSHADAVAAVIEAAAGAK